MQGLYAIGSGGLFGVGLGESMQKLGFVPEAQNDMIFSIVCEELGIVGGVILLLLFAYAEAESRSKCDGHDDLFFENLRNQWGTVLATALSEYDREARS